MHTCCYIHQRFLEKPLLIKIVHFQSYPPSLIQIMVEGVPSMHVCLEFLPEMLNAPSRVWSDFGIMLSGYLIKKYPIHARYKLVSVAFDWSGSIVLIIIHIL